MSFLDLLFGPAPSRLPVPEERLALAALLVRIARADGFASAPELARIERILQSRYGLTPAAAQSLRLEAVPLENRTALVEALWSVALADGQRDADEDRLLRLVSGLLGLSDVESALARQRAARA